jgi:16S rRNA (guanine527-N7)-methyltransferase
MDVSRETLREFVKQLLKWNKSINLISAKDESSIWERHIEDSVQLSGYIPQNSTIIDVGSGGGFPGLVLAILGYNVHLIEIDQRKAIFLREMIRLFNLDSQVYNGDVNYYGGPQADVLTARGYDKLKNLTPLLRFVKSSGFGLFLKGQNYLEELKSCNLESVQIFPNKCSNGVIIKVIKQNGKDHYNS